MNSAYGKCIYTGSKVVKNAYLNFNGQKVAGVSSSAGGRIVGRFDVITPAFSGGTGL